jgi:hypothetical protein
MGFLKRFSIREHWSSLLKIKIKIRIKESPVSLVSKTLKRTGKKSRRLLKGVI